ncbi:MAG TPA: hypothetical protein RMH26_14010, partial [Polyangiaceae bacterium LLY-WYZ-15_(1-7)]|nr:hypothetical protein [Polyangiaceae bacterium LLY-WYZ-15_(1-7)]
MSTVRRKLHDSPYYRIDLVEPGVVWVCRTAAAYPDLDALDAEHVAVERALEPVRGHGLLVDLRETAGRNDPAFEERMRTHRAMIFRDFARAAVVVRTAIGALQVKRHMSEDGFSDRVRVTSDEAEAL